MKTFTVVLLYPEYLSDGRAETFTTAVEAEDVEEAVVEAQHEVVENNDLTLKEMENFDPAFVCEGEVQNILPL